MWADGLASFKLVLSEFQRIVVYPQQLGRHPHAAQHQQLVVEEVVAGVLSLLVPVVVAQLAQGLVEGALHLAALAQTQSQQLAPAPRKRLQ